MNLRRAPQARRECLSTLQRLHRLHDLAVASMFRADAGTAAREMRTHRQVRIAHWLAWAAQQEGSAA